MLRRTGSRRGVSRIRGCSSDGEQPWRRPYDRQRDLPRLVPVLAEDIGSPDLQHRLRIVAMLRRALRAERARARAGHWTYDPARHAALIRAFTLEQRSLKTRERARGAGASPMAG